MKKLIKMAERKMVVSWPEDINKMIIGKQLDMEKQTGKRVKKPDAVITLFRELLSKK